MRTLIKVPLYVMIETGKRNQKELMDQLGDVINEFLLSEEFYQPLLLNLETFKPKLVRTFTEPSLAQELLKLD